MIKEHYSTFGEWFAVASCELNDEILKWIEETTCIENLSLNYLGLSFAWKFSAMQNCTISLSLSCEVIKKLWFEVFVKGFCHRGLLFMHINYIDKAKPTPDFGSQRSMTFQFIILQNKAFSWLSIFKKQISQPRATEFYIFQISVKIRNLNVKLWYLGAPAAKNVMLNLKLEQHLKHSLEHEFDLVGLPWISTCTTYFHR